MKIFKFGGASVKDAAGVHNLYNVLLSQQLESVGLVVSAMGKTTNALEEILTQFKQDAVNKWSYVDQLQQFHLNIVRGLEDLNSQDEEWCARFRESGIKTIVTQLIESLKDILIRHGKKSRAFLYDQVVCHGELLSTRIVAAYLNAHDFPIEWIDARDLIATDDKYRDAGVDWKKTQKQLHHLVNGQSFLTQGFIAADPNGFTTTLGREGSDYTAAIIAYSLGAQSVTIWKDVPGVLSGDPRVFDQMVLLEHISYREAIELAFYGASVIHPKTLQPLQGKQIPLHVKSFIHPDQNGTVIRDGQALEPMVPCFIVRKGLHLLEVAALDFSFIGEGNISDIFNELNEYKLQVGLIQNSAISFTLCVEDKYELITDLIEGLTERYQVNHVANVSLFTIRHYDDKVIREFEKGKNVLLKQLTQETVQLVVKEQE